MRIPGAVGASAAVSRSPLTASPAGSHGAALSRGCGVASGALPSTAAMAAGSAHSLSNGLAGHSPADSPQDSPPGPVCDHLVCIAVHCTAWMQYIVLHGRLLDLSGLPGLYAGAFMWRFQFLAAGSQGHYVRHALTTL